MFNSLSDLEHHPENDFGGFGAIGVWHAFGLSNCASAGWVLHAAMRWICVEASG
jgi:hypothetical protein